MSRETVRQTHHHERTLIIHSTQTMSLHNNDLISTTHSFSNSQCNLWGKSPHHAARRIREAMQLPFHYCPSDRFCLRPVIKHALLFWCDARFRMVEARTRRVQGVRMWRRNDMQEPKQRNEQTRGRQRHRTCTCTCSTLGHLFIFEAS